MKHAPSNPESFLESDQPIPCILRAAKFELDDEGERWVRLDLECAMREAQMSLPRLMQDVYYTLGNAAAVKTDFSFEFPKRLVELRLQQKAAKPSIVLDCTTISRVQFWRRHVESEWKLRFSMNDHARTVGHWAADNYGNPVYVKTLRTQMVLAEGV